MAKIKTIKARQILDSRGTPTVETEVRLDDGSFGRAAVPSGASTGTYEAVELRDGDPAIYKGQSVLKALENVNSIIADKVKGMDAGKQKPLDEALCTLDGTANKGKLGANAILSVSMAAAVAEAASQNLPLFEYLDKLSPRHKQPFLLPTPMCNVMNGGKHAPGASDFQEYMIIPKNFPTFAEKIRAADEIFQTLKQILASQGLSTTVGDEGGFAPALHSNLKPLELIMQAIMDAGYKPGEQVFLGLDFAADEFFAGGRYHLSAEDKVLSTDEMIGYCETLS